MMQIETNWKTRDGLSLYAGIREPENISPKAVVCLVHGIGEHGGRYTHVGDAFTREGFVFMSPDMRGHGKSEGKRGHLASAETILHDIDGYLEEARNRYPGIPLILYGHSLGGIFVLYYGLKRKQGMSGVICTSPGLRNALQDQPVKVLAARILGTLVPGLTIPTGLEVSAISRDAKVVEDYRNDPLVHDKMSVGFGKVMLEIIPCTMEHSGEFSYPLLLMHGSEDSIAFVSGSKAFAASLDGKCNLVIWEGATHELHNEPEKAEVLMTMTDWIGHHFTASSR
jgi:acylglycerol lipase